MRPGRNRWGLATMLILAFFVTSLPVLAAEGSAPDPADSPAGMIFRWLNFALIFGGIAYLIAKPGREYFGSNARAIASSITEGQAAKAAADRELSEVTAKISHLDQEVAHLREAAQRDAAAEAERLRASGQAEVEKIKQAARAELAASGRVAEQQLREAAAALAVQRAGALVSSRMNHEIRANLFHSFLSKLQRSAN